MAAYVPATDAPGPKGCAQSPPSVIATIAGGPNPDDGAGEGGRRGRHRATRRKKAVSYNASSVQPQSSVREWIPNLA